MARTIKSTFELRINDGFGSFSSIFKSTTYDVAFMDLYSLFNQMEKMGVQAGSVELRNEANEVLVAECFMEAARRAKRARQARQRMALHQRWTEAGFNPDDLMR